MPNVSAPRQAAERRLHRAALPGSRGPVYNEEAFRYFLEIEGKRCNRSSRRFLLLLVDLKAQAGMSTDFDAATGTGLFSALSPCLRETDFVGWYRQGRVASAVLTQIDDTQGVSVSNLVVERVREALTQGLAADVATRLQVRVYQVPARDERRS